VTDRHLRRLVKRIREQGDTAMIHRSRGRSSSRKIPVSRDRGQSLTRDRNAVGSNLQNSINHCWRS
jgi:hypothetical protein